MGCKACDEVCPVGLKVSERSSVESIECIACYDCIENCGVNGLHATFLDRKIKKGIYVAILLVILFGFVLVAKLTGNWESSLSYGDYERLLKIRKFITH